MDNRIDIHSEDDTSYTTHDQEVVLKCMENVYCAKHRCLPVIECESIRSNNLFPSTMASGSGESSSAPYDLASDDERY